jgi:tetratricopeptide (TPR) repeat protein
MRTGVVLACGSAALVVSGVLGWIDVRRERDFGRLLAEGERALAAGQTSVAVEAFSGAVALKPQSMLPYLKRGDTYLHRQEWAAADRDLLRASTLDPTAPQPRERRGDVALGEGRFGDAAREYRESLALEDRAPGVLRKLALAEYQAGNHDAAVRAADAALRLEPDRADAQYLRGLALVGARRPGDARRALERAIALDPGAVAPRLALASLHESAHRVQDSLALREAVAALIPDTPGPMLGLADAYVRTGQFDQAEAALARAAERHPTSRAIALARARLLVDRADQQADTANLRRALAMLAAPAEQPDASGDTLALYGRALLLDGSLGAAERTLQRAVRQAPVSPTTFTLLAEAAARRGHAAEAAYARAQRALLEEGP